MADAQRFGVTRYSAAVFCSLLAFLITLLPFASAPAILLRVPFALFYLAVLVSTLYGGRGPGLLSILLCGLGGGYLTVAYANAPFASNIDWPLQVGVFVAVALMIVVLCDAKTRAQNTAYQERERMRVTLESIGDGVIATDKDGRVTFMNEVASRLTGWKLAEGIGKPLGDIFVIVDEATGERVSDLARSLLRGSTTMTSSVRRILVAKDGTPIRIGDSGSPIIDARGKIVGVIIVFHDVSVSIKAEQALQASEERYRELFENANDMLYTIDLQGNLTSINKVGELLIGAPREQLIGRAINDFVVAEYVERLQQMLQRKLEGERQTNYELEIQTFDNRRLMIEISSRLFFEDGKPVGVQGIARDITARKRAEKEREHLLASERAARAEAEAANRTKDEFLATVSHELRTPLSAILGWAHMLRYSDLDERTTERALETIERNARSQAQIVEDILDVSRIVTGKLRLEVMPIELATVIEGAIEAVRPASEAKGIQLEVTVDRRVGPVSADPNRMQQVIWNLLSNAVKFTPRSGRITLSLKPVGSQAEISVTDNGQGISPDFLPFVFDRFRQADSTTTRKHSGLGLGLAIVRYLVEMHGGSVSASSAGEGRGSTFTVRLPLSVVSEEKFERRRAASAQAFDRPRPALMGLHVLVVEDDSDTREVLKAMLERHGARVTSSASAIEALRLIQEKHPDVLLSDIEMPGENGYELIKQVRALEPEGGGRIPAIALTAYGRVDDRLKSLAAGYHLHVTKPVDPEELAALIASVAMRAGASSG